MATRYPKDQDDGHEKDHDDDGLANFRESRRPPDFIVEVKNSKPPPRNPNRDDNSEDDE